MFDLGWILAQIFAQSITNFTLQFPRIPGLHTGMNLFICNMAVSDVVMCLTAAPLTLVTSFTGCWFLGQGPCIILPACQVSLEISSSTKNSYKIVVWRE